jgi:glucuronate isomerase
VPRETRVPTARPVRAVQHRGARDDRVAARSARAHRKIRGSGWNGRVVTAYRPDPVVDPEFDGFRANVARLAELAGENTATWAGYLAAHRNRRAFFKTMGATSTDHGHPTARTCDLGAAECQRLLDRALAGTASPEEAELFRGQLLTEMARMSLDDGLVMQIHPGSFRNHNPLLLRDFGRDKGADIPTRTDYVRALKPLLDRYGNERGLTVILFTLDETSYARELAPLAGHYPILRLGPAWWFHDSPEGMLRFREQVTETAGYYNTVGFNDDTRAFLSIPARHDVARRIDCRFLATQVVEHKIGEDEAFALAPLLAHDLAKAAYRL